ncbi:MAG: response regulator, partial [Burkholderiales bacterium]|nr:response regulator [Anaerolineae bacterium]
WMGREVTQAHLESAGYEVMVAHSGERALELAFATPPDLVLLDIRMHGMNGYEVCRHLKASEITKYAPVVMVTALESDDHKLRAIESGADDFLSKPFNSLMMLTRVRSLLRIKSLHDELEARNSLLRRVLNRYVNEDITDIILSDPDKHLQLGGETRPITVFFADIQGFTAWAEEHRAEDVLTLLNQFFAGLTEIIFECSGTFDKYVGDEIMAFFGAPVATGDDTLNAVRAALEMQQAFAQIQAKIAPHSSQRLGLGIGLHSGDAAVGNVGSERVMNYTVIGDTVNTAKRIQQRASDGMILISEATYALVSDHISAMRLEPIKVKGKREPLTIYNVTGLKSKVRV